MSQLIQTLKIAIAGAEAQALPDPEIRKVVIAIADDERRELTTPDAADFLNKSCATLKRWRKERIGPRFRKDPGGSIRYRIDWLRQFQSEGVVSTHSFQ